MSRILFTGDLIQNVGGDEPAIPEQRVGPLGYDVRANGDFHYEGLEAREGLAAHHEGEKVESSGLRSAEECPHPCDHQQACDPQRFSDIKHHGE